MASQHPRRRRHQPNNDAALRSPPRTPSRSHAAPTAASTPDHWQTAICERDGDAAAAQRELDDLDDEWRGLEDEHNDLLALLAQQELEKNALADFLRQRVGPQAIDDVRRSAETECVSRYGIYVDYDNPDQVADLQDDVAHLPALERHDLDDVAVDLHARVDA